MNKTQLFACVAGVLVGASAFAQGTFAFSTTAKALQGAKILDPNGVAITGANYLIDVLVKQGDGRFSQVGLLKVTTGGNVCTSPPIQAQTIFTLRCVAIGGAVVSKSATVNIIPTFCEPGAHGC